MTEVTLKIKITHYDGAAYFDPHVLAESLMETLQPTHASEPFTFEIIDDDRSKYAVVSADLVNVREV